MVAPVFVQKDKFKGKFLKSFPFEANNLWKLLFNLNQISIQHNLQNVGKICFKRYDNFQFMMHNAMYFHQQFV